MESKYYLLFCLPSFFIGSVMYGTGTFSAIPSVVQVPVSPQFVRSLLRTEGALNTYARLTAMVEEKLLGIKDNIDWINDLMERINEIFKNNPEMRPDINNLNEKQKNVNNIYKACLKELKYEPLGNCSLLVNIIKDLKELQDVTQELRNYARNLLNLIRQLIPKNQDTPTIQGLRGSKLETKLIDQHGFEITETTDQIISGLLTPALEVFNEFAREERGRGLVGTQSNRAL
ncbi:MAG: hypothetical protein LBQ03_01065 [Puniceicoccales bacterium]|jgi:ABC-type transporter Mla subunit MlaD|nr:hypothetical protein [Puniceicoccales bacterium]